METPLYFEGPVPQGRPESSPGGQSWEHSLAIGLLFQFQPRTDVLGYFRVVPSGLDIKAG